MGIKKYLTIATDYIKKYKIPMIILLFGILLLTIPNMIENDESRKEYTENTSESACSSVCQEIEKELGENGRILVRASGTEPVIRVMVEADSEMGCRECVDRVIKKL